MYVDNEKCTYVENLKVGKMYNEVESIFIDWIIKDLKVIYIQLKPIYCKIFNLKLLIFSPKFPNLE